ncbi:MAG TPA: hypothetical protein VMM35_08490 [Longimicrobiales bacterium]|nr:hypothetical protein [Longimicrobiales bacterium]
MRRLAMVLGALAFLWASAATVYVLLTSSETAMSASNMLAASGGEARGRPPSLATADGVWMATLLMAITLLTSLPAGIALRHPSGQRVAAWAAGLMVLGFCLVSGVFLGLLFLPSAILLMAAGAVDQAEPGTSSLRIILGPLV